MNQIIVDDEVKAQLGGLAAPVEVIDKAGQRIGHFPASAATESPYPSEDLESMRAEQGGRKLEDIWKSLGAK
jgi:hypothetical protein